MIWVVIFFVHKGRVLKLVWPLYSQDFPRSYRAPAQPDLPSNPSGPHERRDQNAPFWAPRKKLTCLVSWERMQKGTHINFFGWILGVKSFSATRRLVCCFSCPYICQIGVLTRKGCIFWGSKTAMFADF